jgi:hypothetical protein
LICTCKKKRGIFLILFQKESLFLGLENSLDDLLFFNQESANNAVSDTKTATGTTIGTGDVLLGLGDSGELTRTKGLDLQKESIVTMATEKIDKFNNLHRQESRHSHHNGEP